VLLDRQRVDRAESVQLLANERGLSAKCLVVELQHLGAGQQLVHRLFPFCFKSFPNRGAAARKLGVTKLRSVELFAQRGCVSAHLDKSMLLPRESLVHFAYGAFGVRESSFGVLERCVPRLEIALPLGYLLGELRVCARERGELDLQRFDSPRRRGELLAQMTLAVRRYLELRLRLSARGNLTEQRWLTMEKFHDWPEREALRDALGNNAVFLDVGANAGFYTFWALSLRKPGLRVIAVEPSGAMLQRLRYNLALNQLESAVRVCECAVTPEPGEVVIAEHAENLGQTAVSTEGKGRRVPGRPLLDLLKENGVSHVDALKIDIEGHEIPVLEAFFNTAPRALWPKWIIGEIVGADGGAFQKMLVGRGYTLARATKMNGIFRLA